VACEGVLATPALDGALRRGEGVCVYDISSGFGLRVQVKGLEFRVRV
jgi:hypothetical protein